MSDEGWPADPTHPECPECGEPVSATASYCLHCYSDLPNAEGSPTDASTTTAGAGTTGDAATADGATFSSATDTSTADDTSTVGDTSIATDTSTADDTSTVGDTSTSDDAPMDAVETVATAGAASSTGASSSDDDPTAAGDAPSTTDWSSFSTTAAEAAEGTAFRSTTAGTSATTRDDREAATSTEETGLLDPDGAVDNTVTVVVALFLGTLSAFVATVMVAFPLPGGLPFFAGLITWLVVTGHAARSPTAWEATRRGCYAFAGLLVAMPVLFGLTVPMQDGTLADRVVGLVFFGLFVLPVASFFGVVGFLAGRAGDG